MRSITLKKLSRLLAADDRRSKVSPGARMTTTDWLLFDLVLVHEGPDVIGTIDTAVSVPTITRFTSHKKILMATGCF